MKNLTFGFATTEDEQQIRELLISSELPDEDIKPHLQNFLLVRNGNTHAGCVALELAGDSALLRSLAVRREYRSEGLGNQLCLRIEEYARRLGYTELYLLTTSAVEYFRRRGYEIASRDSAPEGIRNTQQFRGLCPSSAVLMKRRII